MGGLKHSVKGSTFVEALVAQVLVLVVFSAAMTSISSVYKMSLKSVDLRLNSKLAFLEYHYENKGIELPYEEQWEHYDITMQKTSQGRIPFIEVEVFDKRNNKSIIQSFISERTH